MYIEALGPIRHDEERYQSGDIFEIDAKQAATLITDGVAKKSDAKSFKASKPLKDSDDNSLAEGAEGGDKQNEAGKDESAGTE